MLDRRLHRPPISHHPLAELFDGTEAVLLVTPGRHIVELRIGASRIFQKDIYLGDGVVQKIDVNQVEMK